ncbi:MAG TPA: TIM barrel protein [Casimicrobiaceae bacterium]|nr:TIM barrel protein [Casimicrobiaceae bacterium]
MNLDHFAIDAATLAGPLASRLAAIRNGDFRQVMLSASDIARDAENERAAAEALAASGLRAAGLQALRDFEGLSGPLHDYKVGIAKAMLGMCVTLGTRLLLVCSSTSAYAVGDEDAIVGDLRKLATLAVPLGVRVAYKALSWGRHVNTYLRSWELVAAANRSNLGLALDSYHVLAWNSDLAALQEIDRDRIFLVQLSDSLWNETRSIEDRIETARHHRVFPGEGVHGAEIDDFLRRLDALGYRGDYAFDAFNDDYRQIPADVVVVRARDAAEWVSERLTRRAPVVRRIHAASETLDAQERRAIGRTR